jgi:hypothetical protein
MATCNVLNLHQANCFSLRLPQKFYACLLLECWRKHMKAKKCIDKGASRPRVWRQNLPFELEDSSGLQRDS